MNPHPTPGTRLGQCSGLRRMDCSPAAPGSIRWKRRAGSCVGRLRPEETGAVRCVRTSLLVSLCVCKRTSAQMRGGRERGTSGLCPGSRNPARSRLRALGEAWRSPEGCVSFGRPCSASRGRGARGGQRRLLGSLPRGAGGRDEASPVLSLRA